MEEFNWFSFLAFLGMVLLLVGSLTWMVPKDTQEFKCPDCSCPTLSAQEVADLIVVPGVDVPEFKNDQKVIELWNEMFSDKIEALKDLALELTLDEFDEEDLTDFLESEIEGFDELKKLELVEDETEIEINCLGLEDEEDVKVTVELEYKIKYDLKEGSDDKFKDSVFVKSVVSWDEDDEELKAELEYSL